MSNEVTHILRGVFLFVVLAIITRLFLFVSSIQLDPSKEKAAVIALSAPSQLSDLAQKGKVLFKMHCAACHALHKDLTGPSLADAIERWPSKKLLYMWINDWSKAVATGDPYAVKIQNYSPASMPTFNFTDEEIESILAYISEYGKVIPNAMP